MTDSKVRLTISVPAEVAARARAAVEAGGAANVSAYFAAAATSQEQRDEALRRLRQLTGGPPSTEMRAWAMQKLGVTDGGSIAR